MGKRGKVGGVLGVSRSRWDRVGIALALAALGAAPLSATSAQEAQSRVTADVAAGRPIVVHVVVALCDNEHQGIVPVPRHLGGPGLRPVPEMRCRCGSPPLLVGGTGVGRARAT